MAHVSAKGLLMQQAQIFMRLSELTKNLYTQVSSYAL